MENVATPTKEFVREIADFIEEGLVEYSYEGTSAYQARWYDDCMHMHQYQHNWCGPSTETPLLGRAQTPSHTNIATVCVYTVWPLNQALWARSTMCTVIVYTTAKRWVHNWEGVLVCTLCTTEECN